METGARQAENVRVMLRNIFMSALALGATVLASPGLGQELPKAPAAAGGFYGGVAIRDGGVDAAGVNLGRLASTWGRFTSPVSDDAARRALVFGGYRWTSAIALEGS